MNCQEKLLKQLEEMRSLVMQKEDELNIILIPVRVTKAAKHYGVVNKTIYNWVKNGKIKHEKVGGTLYVFIPSNRNRHER